MYVKNMICIFDLGVKSPYPMLSNKYRLLRLSLRVDRLLYEFMEWVHELNRKKRCKLRKKLPSAYISLEKTLKNRIQMQNIC